jgi:plastocyanin
MFVKSTLSPGPFQLFFRERIWRDTNTARRALGIGGLTIAVALAQSSFPGRAFSGLTRNAGTATAFSHEAAAPSSPGTLNGKVTYEGTPKKFRPIDMSAEPNCAKFYSSAPMPDVSITGPANSLQNVIVYISAGAPDEHFTGPVVQLDQRGCRYAPHVLTVQAGQEIWVKNDDTVTHSIHPLAHINAEWNRSQPPGTPPVVIRYDQPEFIKVKCELHPWMRGVVAVFKNSHHAITDSTGAFTLADLPPGKYTVTAWHELYGSQTKELVVTPGEKKSLDFVFKVTPY